MEDGNSWRGSHDQKGEGMTQCDKCNKNLTHFPGSPDDIEGHLWCSHCNERKGWYSEVRLLCPECNEPELDLCFIPTYGDTLMCDCGMSYDPDEVLEHWRDYDSKRIS